MAFREGRALFCPTITYMFKYFSDSDIDYSLVPFPKYDESQSTYYSITDNHAMLFGIPASVKDTDFSGFMLEALSAASTDTTLHAYHEVNCKTKFSYRPETAEVLDLIYEGLVFDPARFYQIGDLSLLLYNRLPGAKSNTFASLYASNESAALNDIDRLMDVIKAIE